MPPRLDRHPLQVAPRLLGARLVSVVDETPVALRITEVEAYGGPGEDPGSHAFRRLTPRNATMFGRPGLAYVYFTYGMHWCLCVVSHGEERAGAVLIRAGEVIEGRETARNRRPRATDRDLARGPARLTQALGIDGSFDGVDLLADTSLLQLEPLNRPVRRSEIAVSPRTGVAGEGASTPWRFHLLDEPTVSPYRAAAPRARRSPDPSIHVRQDQRRDAHPG